MVRKRTAASSGGTTKALAIMEPTPLTAATEAAVAPAIGSGRGIARLQGTGGEVIREDGSPE